MHSILLVWNLWGILKSVLTISSVRIQCVMRSQYLICQIAKAAGEFVFWGKLCIRTIVNMEERSGIDRKLEVIGLSL